MLGIVTCPDTYVQSATCESGVQVGSVASTSKIKFGDQQCQGHVRTSSSPSRPREFGVCRPWNWYPRSVNVLHQWRMSHVLDNDLPPDIIMTFTSFLWPLRTRTFQGLHVLELLLSENGRSRTSTTNDLVLRQFFVNESPGLCNVEELMRLGRSRRRCG